MNKISFVLVLLSVLILTTFTLTQEGVTRIAFVDSQAAIGAHPSGEASKALEAQAQQEITALQTDLQTLVEKANSGQQLSADEQNRFQTLRSTLTSVQQRYATEIGETVQPALEAVDTVIRAIAEENGYTLVLDSTVAGPQGINLVVYAQEGLNITPQVVERIRAQ